MKLVTITCPFCGRKETPNVTVGRLAWFAHIKRCAKRLPKPLTGTIRNPDEE